jgi:hypothetical protein
MITSNLVAVSLPPATQQSPGPLGGVGPAVVRAPAPLAASSPDSYRAGLAAAPAHAGAAPALRGPEGCVRGRLVASVAASGVRSVTFYLDGRKLRKLSSRDVRAGRLSISIAAAGLPLGAHRLIARIAMRAQAPSTAVYSASRALTFVRCGSSTVTPRFTG